MTVITSKAIRTYLSVANSLRIMRALSHPYSKINTSNDQGKKTVITIADKILLHMFLDILLASDYFGAAN